MRAGARGPGVLRKLLLCAAALFVPDCGAVAGETASRLNLVFILLDNFGQEWWGCYGSQEGCTPNLDRLAHEGVRVENCYAPPVCSPSRVTALTGRYLFRSGWVLHHDAALYGGGGLDPRREITFARLFRDVGYDTAIVGKWQINHLYEEPDALARHGFNEALVWPGSVDWEQTDAGDRGRFAQAMRDADVPFLKRVTAHIESRYWDPVLLRNGRRETHPGRFGPDVMQEFALEFLRRHRHSPFLLYYPMVLTHNQGASRGPVSTPLNRDERRSKQELYADMVRYADRLVGAFAAELDGLGLSGNTVLFVAADNGTEGSFSARRNGRVVRGGCYQLSEPGANVALIIHAPGLVPGGRTVQLADFSDLLPTFCALTGVPPPADRAIDGRSLAAVLRGDPGAREPRRWIFNMYGDERVVRDARYKLYSDGQFFDLARDPDERRNLTEGALVERARLQAALDALPPDAPSPFEPRSLSAFGLRSKTK